MPETQNGASSLFGNEVELIKQHGALQIWFYVICHVILCNQPPSLAIPPGLGIMNTKGSWEINMNMYAVKALYLNYLLVYC